MKIRALLIFWMLTAATVASAEKTPTVSVPDAAWADLLPYVQLHLMVTWADGNFTIGASGRPNGTVSPAPFDAALDEFATVLLSEVMAERKIRKVLERTPRSLKGEKWQTDPPSEAELTMAVWRRLSGDETFARTLETRFDQACRDSSLDCSICAQGFIPRHLELR